ncbi:MAG: FG-GAP repeat protein [Nanoarchaeota archaeon]|nr:FG-GAP repeat protein [Nanoarchaeota archaeon]MBU4456923.1 FG-GAP repeat protein [Nanoarchaeota archaeon]MCG2719206.1 hypothetical protein [Nanoarchaeota archaeon]
MKAKIVTLFVVLLFCATIVSAGFLTEKVKDIFSSEEKDTAVKELTVDDIPEDILQYIKEDQMKVFDDGGTLSVIHGDEFQATFENGEVIFSNEGWSVSSDLIKIFNDEKEIDFDQWEVSKDKLSVIFDNDILTQEFIHEDEGIEQTFTVKENFGNSFTLVSELGDVDAEILANGDLMITTKNGVMFMGAPKAWDANDKVLDAKFRLDDNLNIEVSGAEAYPVFIDPLWVFGKQHGEIKKGSGDSAYGFAIAGIGDFDDNGYDDVLIGAPNYTEDGVHITGKVYLYVGSEEGLKYDPIWAKEGMYVGCGFNDTFSGLKSEFGYSLSTAGDMNNDGYLDFAVGEPGWNNNKGRVVIFFGGGANGVDESKTGCFYGSTVAGDRLGHTILGDINVYSTDTFQDLYDDLVVSAPYANNNKGRIYVVKGTSTGFGTTAAWYTSGGSIEEVGSEFGFSLAKISNTKIAIGSPKRDSGKGMVSIWRAQSLFRNFKFNINPDWTLIAKLSNGSYDQQNNAKFGYSLSLKAENVYGSPDLELLIGAPYYDGAIQNTGKAYLWEMNYETSSPGQNPVLEYIPKYLDGSPMTSYLNVRLGLSVALNPKYGNSPLQKVVLISSAYSLGTFLYLNTTDNVPDAFLQNYNNATTDKVVVVGYTSPIYQSIMLGTTTNYKDGGSGSDLNMSSKFVRYILPNTSLQSLMYPNTPNPNDLLLFSDIYLNDGGYTYSYTYATIYNHPLFNGVEIIGSEWFNGEKSFLLVGSPNYGSREPYIDGCMLQPWKANVGKWYIFEYINDKTGGFNGFLPLPVATLQGKNAGEFLGFSGNITPSPSSSEGVAIGDFNGDDIPDIAIASPMLFNKTVTPYVSMYLGSEDGHWFDSEADEVYESFHINWSLRALSAGDVNQDGYDDLLIGSRNRGSAYGLEKKSKLLLLAGNNKFPLKFAAWSTQASSTYNTDFGRYVHITKGSLNQDDNYPELVTTDPDMGGILVYKGKSSLSTISSSPDIITDGPIGLNTRLASGNVVGGRNNLIVSKPYDCGIYNQGCVTIYDYISGSSLHFIQYLALSLPYPDTFGISMSVEKLYPTSGQPHLAIGAPTYVENGKSVGKVFVYAPVTAGTLEKPVWTSTTDRDCASSLGYKVRIGRINYGTAADLIVAYQGCQYHPKHFNSYSSWNQGESGIGNGIIFLDNSTGVFEDGLKSADW